MTAATMTSHGPAGAPVREDPGVLLEPHDAARADSRRCPERIVLVAGPGAASASAARWVASRSVARSRAVDVLLTGPWRTRPDHEADRGDLEEMRSVLAESPHVRVGERIVAGDDCQAAVASSLGPDLVVLGADRIDAVCRRLRTALEAAGDRPRCPIVVVPTGWLPTSGRVMAVFERGDEAAVAFAAHEAAAADTPLALVCTGDDPACGPMAPTRERSGGLRRVRDLLSMRPGALEVDELQDGTAVRTVLRAGTGAVLLVASSHRFDALDSLLTGPTSPAVIERAPCPVAIVHPGYRQPADRVPAAASAGLR